VPANGVITRGGVGVGVDYACNAAGERVSATRTAQLSRQMWRYTADDGSITGWENREDLAGGTWAYVAYNCTGTLAETFFYDAGGAPAPISWTLYRIHRPPSRAEHRLDGLSYSFAFC